MTKGLLSAITLSLALAGALAAHGGGEHITGFVMTITDASITVETATHQRQTILLTPKTEAMRSGKKGAVSDLKPGERVVVHAIKNKDGKLEAEELQFGTAVPVAPHADHH